MFHDVHKTMQYHKMMIITLQIQHLISHDGEVILCFLSQHARLFQLGKC